MMLVLRFTLMVLAGSLGAAALLTSPTPLQLVHAESERARGFYEHLIPEFERSPTDPLHLLLLLKDICRTLGR